MSVEQRDLIKFYRRQFDQAVHKSFFCESGYSNFGYWDDRTQNGKEACDRLMARLLESVPKKSGRVLDVACGQGGTTNHLLRFYEPSSVAAINMAPDQIDAARKKASGCEFRVMDAVKLDYEDATFDAVVCIEAAFHFNTRENFLREASRVLKPGGDLIMTDLLFHKSPWGVPPANYLSSGEAYRRLLCETGFEPIEVVSAQAETFDSFRRAMGAHASSRNRALGFGVKAWLTLIASRVRDVLLIHARRA